MVNEMIIFPSYFERNTVFEDLDEMEENMLLTHYASSLLEKGLPGEEELEQALHKAITAITAASLPANRHFRKIFVSYGHDLKTDWLVSDLALRLIMMNADVSNPIVARLQVEILSGR